MINLNKLAAEIHEAAVKKKFWNKWQAADMHLAKMISELGEIVQADRMGMMYEVEHDGAKPEGVIAEMADFVMMAIDYAVVYRVNVKRAIVKGRRDNGTKNLESSSAHIYGNTKPYVHIMRIAKQWCDIPSNTYSQKHKKIAEALGDCVALFEAYAYHHGFDLWKCIREKMAYNESRPALHGMNY